MRNLRNIKHSVIDFAKDEQPLTATAWDPSNDSLICAFGPSELSPALTLKRLASDAYKSDQAAVIASWDAPSPNLDLPVDSVVNLHYFADTTTVCLVLTGGDLVVVREQPLPGEDLIEIVGSVDAGISAASWSPDEEILIVTTKADTVLFMTRDFGSTANVVLAPGDIRVSSHVSVGWGKSETQFRGRGAKALRDPTMPEHVDEGTLSPNDSGCTNISWRGDGAWVAVNSVLDVEPKRRTIRVYSREGVLDSVSEPVNDLGDALSWKPTGQLLAGIQRLQDRIEVVFFERNGLRHGQFRLRLTKEHMEGAELTVGLKWNSDSTVLAVIFKDRVQLWTTGNYHWYMKQNICFSSPAMAASVTWHPEKALQLALSGLHSVQSLSYTLATSNGSLMPPNDFGITAVTDGRKLKLTPMRLANIPPPMAYEEIDLPDITVDVSISRTGSCIAVLHQDTFSIWSCDFSKKPAAPSRLLKIFTLPPFLDSEYRSGTLIPRQISFLNDSEVAVLSTLSNEQSSVLKGYLIENGQETLSLVNESSVVTLCTQTGGERAYYEAAGGTVRQLGSNVEMCGEESCIDTIPTACPYVEVWREKEHTIVFGLSSSGTLFIRNNDQDVKILGCTSFLVTQAHLIYTTASHLLKFVHLHGGKLEISPDEPEKDERCRNIERGARLVTVMPSSYSLVLQMPRGNLETIHPRALVLAGLRRDIAAKDYKTALLACRTHRVDMNILHDYAPEQFMASVPLFLKQIKKVQQVDLFLSQLSEENVAETLYKETLIVSPGREPDNLTNGPNGHVAHSMPRLPLAQLSKVNKICNAFLDILRSQPTASIQNQITAHICKNPPDLEAGVRLVARLQEQRSDKLEEAVEHICFLGDVNQLFDAALGLYDLEVTLLVAQQSQKDPREYLPYLQELQNMDPRRMRFSIDNDLKRYGKALVHLHAMDAFDQLRTYTQKHELYSAAINLYRYDTRRLQELMRLQAYFLASRNCYKEAGIAYDYLQDYASAYEAYRSANLWRECLASASLVPVSEDELASLATDLADGLLEAKNFADAAVIQHQYLHDLGASVSSLCKGYHFAEAIRLVGLDQKAELLKTAIDPGLIDGSASMTETLAEMKSQLNAQVPRLRELRQKRNEDPMAFLDGAVGDGADIPDNISLAPTDASTSGGTFMTRYTNRSTGTLATNATRKTSKNRRREERKRARGKKGTIYEEEYLVNSIARLIERLDTIREEVQRLVEGLLRRAMRERALAVEAAIIEAIELAISCIVEVFQPPIMTEVSAEGQQQAAGESQSRPWGGRGVLWEALTEFSQRREPPVLKPFESLSLLS